MDDLVKRSDVLEALDLCDFVRDNEYQDGACLLFRESVIEVIKALPPAERKKGKWITKSTNGEMSDVCSVCGYVEWDEPHNYCPNCGAEMRGDKDD